MKRFILTLALAGLLVPALAVAAATPAGPIIVMGDAVKWVPGTGDLKGAHIAMLAGDFEKAGSLYAARIKLPDGFKFPPHSHGLAEQVTVMSGTFLVGLGDKVDAAKMKPLGPGSFVDVPAKIEHYAMAKGETVLELHGIGPMTMEMPKGKM
ncbi:MAG: cupin domain-containing protein [Candidatus Eremiobacteraeota bacterium]|nr:cupin domain-containing protein [Candidatus Eremiobacteraeota bacterium]